MKRNHSLLEYTRDNESQASELGLSGPSCFTFPKILKKSNLLPVDVYKNYWTEWHSAGSDLGHLVILFAQARRS